MPESRLGVPTQSFGRLNNGESNREMFFGLILARLLVLPRAIGIRMLSYKTTCLTRAGSIRLCCVRLHRIWHVQTSRGMCRTEEELIAESS